MNLVDFRRTICEYFEECEASGAFPDEAAMALRLGITREMIEEWLEDSSRGRAGYRRALLDARLRRESVITRGIYASEKSTSGKVFLARQAASGGLHDKPKETREKVAVKVIFRGAPDAFD
jgi:hypothetical protein